MSTPRGFSGEFYYWGQVATPKDNQIKQIFTFKKFKVAQKGDNSDLISYMAERLGLEL